MTNVTKPDSKIINLLKGNSNEKRLERKIVNVLERGKNNRSNKSALDNRSFLNEMAKEVNKNISDNDMLFQILPDLKLAMSFLISGILSPKDLLGCQLNYTLKNVDIKKEVISGVTNVIEDYFTEQYNLNSLLPKILEDVLFLTGSYSLLILPETEIDRLINSDCSISKESISSVEKNIDKNMGFISGNKKIHKSLVVTDNFNILKKPWINDAIREQKITDIMSEQVPSMENVSIHGYKRKYSHVPISITEVSNKDVIGEPVVLKIPSESIIPIHIPGDPEKHVGYFILLDELGYPVNGKTDRKVYEQLQGRLSTETEDNVRELIKQTKMAIFGYEETSNQYKQFNIDTYTKIVEAELKDKLANGIYGHDAEIADIGTISKIMLARALKEKQSTLLFVPEKLISYIAFKYNDSGIGKSLLEDTRILSSLRSILMFSNVIASMKNSVPRTGVKIDLDETDTNPRETVEFLLNEFSRNYNQAFPIGLTNPADIVDAIQRSSIDVAVSGNTRYPETNIDVTDKTRSVAKPDPDLENQLRRRQYMAFGLPPEIIDADMNIDYAVSVISSNALATKEITINQNKLNYKLSDFVRKYIISSEKLTNAVMEKIGKNKKVSNRTEEYNQILRALNITLPAPDNTKLENQLSALDTYSSGLDKALESYFSTDIVGRLIDADLEDAIEPTRECIRTYFLRQWMQKNNVFNELINLIDVSDSTTKLRMDEIQKDHIDSLLETVGKLMIKIQKKGNDVLTDVENKLGEEKPPNETGEENDEGEENEGEESEETGEEESEEGEEPGEEGGEEVEEGGSEEEGEEGEEEGEVSPTETE